MKTARCILGGEQLGSAVDRCDNSPLAFAEEAADHSELVSSLKFA